MVHEAEEDQIEVTAIDPMASMPALQNAQLQAVTDPVQAKRRRVIARRQSLIDLRISL
jgi:hypothetical protein